jgi:outer membrane protein OmpA-like peptidoglycan-associated protein
MQLRNALLAATFAAMPLAIPLAIPPAAQAQPVTGLYVGGGLGINIMQDENFRTGGAFVGSGQVGYDVGPTGVLSVGWGFGNGFRAEVEANYMANKLSGASGFGGGVTSAGGWEQKFGGMVNGYYDFYNLVPWVVPYVGLGVGYEGMNLESASLYGPGGVGRLTNGTMGYFAYQAMLGAAYPIATVPGLAVTAEYRFMGLAGERRYDYTTAGGGGDVKLGDNYNHAIMIGVRYNFGVAPAPAPAPAPMAAPAPAPARSYLVFFDWDKADLTPRAQQIIREAADNSTKVKYTRIEVNGYTDTSGTPQYNQGLSVRRAQAVAGELVRDGVPQSAISIQGFGETHLLVPTGAGVREPQNRRVEIVIR